MRSTHTYVILEISPEAFAEIHGKLKDAGYEHTFGEDEGKPVVDMHGIALKAEESGDVGPREALAIADEMANSHTNIMKAAE